MTHLAAQKPRIVTGLAGGRLPDLVEDEDAEDKDDKPEVVGDEVDLEEIEADDDDEEDDDTLIESVDDDDDVGDIIDKGDLDKE